LSRLYYAVETISYHHVKFSPFNSAAFTPLLANNDLWPLTVIRHYGAFSMVLSRQPRRWN